MSGHVGCTFPGKVEVIRQDTSVDYTGAVGPSFTGSVSGDIQMDEQLKRGSLHQDLMTHAGSFDESVYDHSKWCYDSPGLINPRQVQTTQLQCIVQTVIFPAL